MEEVHQQIESAWVNDIVPLWMLNSIELNEYGNFPEEKSNMNILWNNLDCWSKGKSARLWENYDTEKEKIRERGKRKTEIEMRSWYNFEWIKIIFNGISQCSKYYHQLPALTGCVSPKRYLCMRCVVGCMEELENHKFIKCAFVCSIWKTHPVSAGITPISSN